VRKSKILTTAKMSVLVLWVVASSGLWQMQEEAAGPPKHWYQLTSSHHVTTQNNTDIYGNSFYRKPTSVHVIPLWKNGFRPRRNVDRQDGHKSGESSPAGL
jgi:hypothetical protein